MRYRQPVTRILFCALALLFGAICYYQAAGDSKPAQDSRPAPPAAGGSSPFALRTDLDEIEKDKRAIPFPPDATCPANLHRKSPRGCRRRTLPAMTCCLPRLFRLNSGNPAPRSQCHRRSPRTQETLVFDRALHPDFLE
jgi:hypothetical protein